MTHRTLSVFVAIAAVALGSGRLVAGQGRAGQAAQAPAPPPTGKAAAPIDLTGSFVSIVTEDWRWRMVTPAKGDYQSVPINAEGKKMADAWDPAKDEAAGEQCRSYGAAGLMRVPGRLRIGWQDDNTLKVEADAGMQTRLFHFGAWKAPAPAKPSWQGDSIAEWENGGRGGPTTGSAPGTSEGGGGGSRFGNLKVVTRNMRPGYLRKNGIPYSAETVLTEYWDFYRETNGDQYIVITTYVDDPKYLQQVYVTTPNFQKEADGSKWDPTPCSAKW